MNTSTDTKQTTTTMTVRLEQLTLAELRDLSRQHGLPESYNADDMRQRLCWHVTQSRC